MFLAAPISGLMTSPAAFVRFVDTEQDREYERFFETDSFRSVVKSIKIAPGVAYPLRRECSAYFIPVKGEFIVEGFALVGRGNSSDEAEHDWKLKVHEAFQHLLAMRPFEMSDKDRQDCLFSRP